MTAASSTTWSSPDVVTSVTDQESQTLPVYLIVNVDVHDPERYADYAALAPATVAEFGGRYLARGGTTEVLEGDTSPRRHVVVEFPSMDIAKAWHDSEGYRAARAIRDTCATSSFVVVEGV